MFFPCPRSRLRIWSRETGLAVPSRVSLLFLHTQAESGAYSREFLPISAAASIYLYRHTPSGQSLVFRITQLRTDGAHCRESASTGPVVLNAVPVTGAAFASHHGPINVRLYFPTPTIGMKWACLRDRWPCHKWRRATEQSQRRFSGGKPD